MPVAVPETRFTKTADGLTIVYQTLGNGPPDIAFIPFLSCLDVMWEEPAFAHALQRLAAVGRLICFERRGFGASDPIPLGALPTPETWVDDLRVVLDDVGSTSSAILCHGPAGYIGVLFAATYPERTDALVLVNYAARVQWADDLPYGMRPSEAEALISAAEAQWGTGVSQSVFAPSRASDEAFLRWAGRWERGAASRAVFGRTARWIYSLDMRPVLPAVRAPTLVISMEDDTFPLEHGRYLADHISGAKLTMVPGGDHFVFSIAAGDLVLDHIEEFITGVPPVREPNRALATVLFTDIVGSTEHAARLGDRRWAELLNQHDALVLRELERHRGRKVSLTGDGLLATFDGPARAIHCALGISSGARSLGLEVRAGLHTGEVELRGEDIGGIAVHIGQRVSAVAGPDEVLVSRTVVDLVTGSGIEFEDRGQHELKGVPGTWRLFAVAG